MTEPPPLTPSSFRCRGCGYDLTGISIGGHCPECGMSVDQSLMTPSVPGTSGLAVTSLVLGTFSLVACLLCAPLSFVMGPTAIILGTVALRGERSSGTNVCAGIGIAFGALATAALAIFFFVWSFGTFPMV